MCILCVKASVIFCFDVLLELIELHRMKHYCMTYLQSYNIMTRYKTKRKNILLIHVLKLGLGYKAQGSLLAMLEPTK